MTDVVVTTTLLVVIALEVETVGVTAVVATVPVVTPALVVATELCVGTLVTDDEAATPPSPTVERSVEFEPLHAASHTTPSEPSKRPTVFIVSPFSDDDGTESALRRLLGL
jgi:hypothetical protein